MEEILRYALYIAFFIATVIGIVYDARNQPPRVSTTENEYEKTYRELLSFLNDQFVDALILGIVLLIPFSIETVEHKLRPGGWTFFERSPEWSLRFDDFLDLFDMIVVLYILHRAIRRLFRVLPFS